MLKLADKSNETDERSDNGNAAEKCVAVAKGFHACPRCGIMVSDERLELLGVEECKACTPQKRPPIGVWDYPEGFHERNEGVGGLVVID